MKVVLRRLSVAAIVVTLGGMGVALAQQSLQIYVQGKATSVPVRVINGVTYVPLSDIARAYGDQVVKRPDGLALVPAGGANQVGGREGKIGEDLFTGQFKFQVREMQIMDTYDTRFESRKHTIKPGDNETLVILNCRIKNGTTQDQELAFAASQDYGIRKIALTDNDEHSYKPFNFEGGTNYGFDVRADETAPIGAHILPGAALDFALIFNVPKGTKPKDLVFGMLKYKDRAEKDDRAAYVRVHLAP